MSRPPARALKVLMVGPPAQSAGGMYAVANGIRRGLLAAGSSTRVILSDSGGGLGRRGYLRFPLAIADVVRLHPDVVHLHVASKGSTIRKSILAVASRAAGVPYVLHLHGGGYANFLASLPVPARRAVGAFFRGAAQVVVLGDGWKHLVVEELGVPERRVSVVHNGVPDVGVASSAAREVLFIGSATRDKGADVLVAAVHTVFSQGDFPGWSVRFVGTTPDSSIVGEAAVGPAAERIRFSGPLFGAAKNEAIRASALLALPSRAEALPMVVLEAMSAGLPCVCSDVGSIREVVEDGVTGLVVSPGNAPELAAALTTLMQDDALRRRMGSAGRTQWATGLTQESMAGAIERVWQQAAP